METSEYSNLFTVTKPLSSQQKKIIENQINDIYFDFVNRVADGRKMSFDEVDEIAQGRIWSGIDAVEVGLADTLGNLKTALSIAARLAGIDKYKVLEYPEQKEEFEKIVDLLYSEVETRLDYFIFDEPFGYLQKLNEGLQYTGIQTRLPFT